MPSTSHLPSNLLPSVDSARSLQSLLQANGLYDLSTGRVTSLHSASLDALRYAVSVQAARCGDGVAALPTGRAAAGATAAALSLTHELASRAVLGASPLTAPRHASLSIEHLELLSACASGAEAQLTAAVEAARAQGPAEALAISSLVAAWPVARLLAVSSSSNHLASSIEAAMGDGGHHLRRLSGTAQEPAALTTVGNVGTGGSPDPAVSAAAVLARLGRVCSGALLLHLKLAVRSGRPEAAMEVAITTLTSVYASRRSAFSSHKLLAGCARVVADHANSSVEHASDAALGSGAAVASLARQCAELSAREAAPAAADALASASAACLVRFIAIQYAHPWDGEPDPPPCEAHPQQQHLTPAALADTAFAAALLSHHMPYVPPSAAARASARGLGDDAGDSIRAAAASFFTWAAGHHLPLSAQWDGGASDFNSRSDGEDDAPVAVALHPSAGSALASLSSHLAAWEHPGLLVTLGSRLASEDSRGRAGTASVALLTAAAGELTRRLGEYDVSYLPDWYGGLVDGEADDAVSPWQHARLQASAAGRASERARVQALADAGEDEAEARLGARKRAGRLAAAARSELPTAAHDVSQYRAMCGRVSLPALAAVLTGWGPGTGPPAAVAPVTVLPALGGASQALDARGGLPYTAANADAYGNSERHNNESPGSDFDCDTGESDASVLARALLDGTAPITRGSPLEVSPSELPPHQANRVGPGALAALAGVFAPLAHVPHGDLCAALALSPKAVRGVHADSRGGEDGGEGRDQREARLVATATQLRRALAASSSALVQAVGDAAVAYAVTGESALHHEAALLHAYATAGVPHRGMFTALARRIAAKGSVRRLGALSDAEVVRTLHALALGWVLGDRDALAVLIRELQSRVLFAFKTSLALPLHAQPVQAESEASAGAALPLVFASHEDESLVGPQPAAGVLRGMPAKRSGERNGAISAPEARPAPPAAAAARATDASADHDREWEAFLRGASFSRQMAQLRGLRDLQRDGGPRASSVRLRDPHGKPVAAQASSPAARAAVATIDGAAEASAALPSPAVASAVDGATEASSGLLASSAGKPLRCEISPWGASGQKQQQSEKQSVPALQQQHARSYSTSSVLAAPASPVASPGASSGSGSRGATSFTSRLLGLVTRPFDTSHLTLAVPPDEHWSREVTRFAPLFARGEAASSGAPNNTYARAAAPPARTRPATKPPSRASASLPSPHAPPPTHASSFPVGDPLTASAPAGDALPPHGLPLDLSPDDAGRLRLALATLVLCSPVPHFVVQLPQSLLAALASPPPSSGELNAFRALPPLPPGYAGEAAAAAEAQRQMWGLNSSGSSGSDSDSGSDGGGGGPSKKRLERKFRGRQGEKARTKLSHSPTPDGGDREPKAAAHAAALTAAAERAAAVEARRAALDALSTIDASLRPVLASPYDVPGLVSSLHRLLTAAVQDAALRAAAVAGVDAAAAANDSAVPLDASSAAAVGGGTSDGDLPFAPTDDPLAFTRFVAHSRRVRERFGSVITKSLVRLQRGSGTTGRSAPDLPRDSEAAEEGEDVRGQLKKRAMPHCGIDLALLSCDVDDGSLPPGVVAVLPQVRAALARHGVQIAVQRRQAQPQVGAAGQAGGESSRIEGDIDELLVSWHAIELPGSAVAGTAPTGASAASAGDIDNTASSPSDTTSPAPLGCIVVPLALPAHRIAFELRAPHDDCVPPPHLLQQLMAEGGADSDGGGALLSSAPPSVPSLGAMWRHAALAQAGWTVIPLRLAAFPWAPQHGHGKRRAGLCLDLPLEAIVSESEETGAGDASAVAGSGPAPSVSHQSAKSQLRAHPLWRALSSQLPPAMLAPRAQQQS